MDSWLLRRARTTTLHARKKGVWRCARGVAARFDLVFFRAVIINGVFMKRGKINDSLTANGGYDDGKLCAITM